MNRTPLFESHKALGANMVDFGGWEMPVYYTNIIDEHNATRNGCGLFDICHMGEIFVHGPDAFKLVQWVVSRDISNLQVGQMALGVLCRDDGGILDDLTVYKLSETKYMIVVNAGTREKDFEWIRSKVWDKQFNVVVEDKIENYAKLDIQGPKAQEILQKIVDFDLSKIKFYNFVEQKRSLLGIDCIISRSGYTGEDGFEVYFDRQKAKIVWDKLITIGKLYGLKPVGLGARDTLRLEAAFNLYGNEMDEKVSPFECRYGWVVSDKKDFVGKDKVFERKQSSQWVLAGFEMTCPQIARHGYKVFKGGEEIGVVTSGGPSPTLKKNIGLCSINKEFSPIETQIEVEVRGKFFPAKIVSLPFYKRSK